MFGHFPQATKEHLNRAFPERQIIHRTSGQVHCFVISQRAQIAAVSGAALVATWCVFTLLNLAWGNNPFRSPAKEVRRMEAQYERLLIDARAKEANARALLQAQQIEFTEAAADFRQKHDALKDIMGGTIHIPDIAPAHITQYASQNILMAPIARDPLPRQARTNTMTSTQASATNMQGTSFINLSLDQNDILLESEIAAQASIEINRAIIRSSGLDLEKVLQAGPFGTGGPLVPPENEQNPEIGNFGSRIASIRARVSEADALSSVMASLPLGQPVTDEHYRTSPYGPRKDPFTKRTAFHQGLDLAGRKNTPILATAAGRVSYVGLNGGYGRVVEIEHEHGIKTRYAHLAKTFVKRGQIIVKGEKIGGMGSTGRSTSTHLHYEVRFQGRATDPTKFMKAGRYVQQN
ncbi:MAG: M23 family metallopeptidase [Robiginitomaculum sp.]